MISLGVSKGRVAKETIKALESIGYAFSEDIKTTRKLILTSKNNKLQLILMKGQDIPIYVDAGVIDMGIVGKDILNESNSNVYELLNLNIGKCKIAVAGYKGYDFKSKSFLKVGTKYPNTTKTYLDALNIPHSIVYLNGSVELAPLIGLSDIIVDIVETGTTLKENKLEVLASIQEISSRLIVNKILYKTKFQKIDPIVNILKENLTTQ